MGNFDNDFDVTLRLGAANFQADDYLMLLVVVSNASRKHEQESILLIFRHSKVLYTALIVCLNMISDGGGSNLYPPGLEKSFTAKDIQDRIYGSKVVVVSEQVMLNLIYTIKACMLVMYTRLTLGLRDQLIVRCLAIYVFIGWLATEIAFFTACQPFEGYWAIPPPDPQCTTLQKYAIVQGSFNITSDLVMICIPMPLILRMALPWRQKIVIAFIFSLGIFVILAALLTKIFNLTDVYDDNYMLWYVREASVAVYTSNLPMIWPLLRDWFPCLRDLTPGADRTDERQPARAGLTGKASGGTTLRSSSLEPAAGVHRKGPAYDVEMAIRAIELDDESKREIYRRRELEDQIGVGGWHDRSSIDQAMCLQSPPRSVSRATTVESDLRYLQMEQEARDMIMMGGIQVKTSFTVQEEVATPPQSSHGGPSPEPWAPVKPGW
ncbi:hypothetical protein KVR01_005908 [Diaporthe batatas]|uniref:uncharacterized protein n=1 Tax=Diaporthe batatas TaxID=748121 RepID=UPI001D045A6D|nr:uncharacterized protein KVR01_005908 [Diaporthe batatas]KAG8163990.1 hypothetical protein KVR01_005908 [Diaporthe batatas]